MKNMSYTSININGVFSDEKNLQEICRVKLSDERNPEWERKFYQFIKEWISTESFIKTRTSGSTGKPKPIRISKEKMIQSALMTGKFFSLKPIDKALLCLPVDFIAGKMMVVRSFVLGFNLCPVQPSTNSLEFTKENFDFAAITPMQVHNILSGPGGYVKLNRISKLIIGGSDIHPELLQKIKSLKNESWQTYGMTETITHIAVRKLNPPDDSENYKALPGITFRKDERKCLVIKAPHLSNKEIVTNDIVELINEREFRFIGRFDNVINSGGIKVTPEIVEAKLSRFIPSYFIIAGFPDSVLGEKIVLIIEGSEIKDLNLNDLARQAGLSKFEIPKQVFWYPGFPLTKSGKIIRDELINLIKLNNEIQ
jgi:o-succinylbenzoate---CoA ligase